MILNKEHLRFAIGRLARFVLIAGCLTLGFAVESHAQDGRIVKSIDIRYVGAKTVSEGRILTRMSTKVGQPLAIAKIDADVKALYESGEVDNVKMLSEDTGDGVALIVVVQSRSLYGGAQFVGNTVFDSSKLSKKVALSVSKSIDEGLIRKARKEIQEMYRKKGYPETTVAYKIGTPNSEGFSSVVFTINEGHQGVLRDIEFVGNNSMTADELKSVMSQKEKTITSVVTGSGRTDPDSLTQDIRSIEEMYRDRGYLNAKVVNVAKAPVDSKYNDLIITIDEGQQYSVSGIQLAGINALSQESDIVPHLQTKAGEPFSGAKLRADIKRINDAYGSEGYIDARVVPRLEEGSSPGQVGVRLAVEEGQAFTVGQIHIEGNDKTKDRVLRRELPILPGDPLDVNTVSVAERRLLNLNYFDVVEVTPVDSSYLDKKDLVVKVREKSTGSFNFGAGFSSIDSITGFLEVTQSNFDLFNWPNFIGGGQRFRLSLRGGEERRDFSLSITEPWFLGKRLAVTGEGYYRDLLFLSDDYEQTTFGGALSLRRGFGRHSFGSLEYRYEVLDIEADDDASQLIQNEEGRFEKSSLSFNFTYDDRDDFHTPRSGQKISFGYEYAGIGGDVNDSLASFEVAKHITFKNDLIINAVGRYRYAANGDHLFTRYFLGGSNNLRGFDFRDVGPKDIERAADGTVTSSEGIGGRNAYNFTVEATYPLVDKIRLAAFYDGGEVSGGPAGSEGGGYNSNWGLGVRLFLLGNSPVRLDYALPLDTDEFNDEGGQFNFTIGTQF